MAQHNELGKLGEKLALKYLQDNGYEILAANWTYGKAEVDLIAYAKHQLIFVEVKTRSSALFGFPEEFISEQKQKLLQLAATEYIYRMNHQGEIRFDVIAILIDSPHSPILNHIEDAFWPT